MIATWYEASLSVKTVIDIDITYFYFSLANKRNVSLFFNKTNRNFKLIVCYTYKAALELLRPTPRLPTV